MASLSGWTEAGVGIILFMLAIGIIIFDMNLNYTKNYDVTFGIDTTSDLNNFTKYQDTLGKSLQGTASQNANTVLFLDTAWGIIQTGGTIVLNLLTGQWIVNSISLLQLGSIGTYLALGLRLLFVFSIGFIILKILFRVKP